jgi:N-carbamoyl-L-amino-acid hydrolase
MPLTLEQLNAASPAEALRCWTGVRTLALDCRAGPGAAAVSLAGAPEARAGAGGAHGQLDAQLGLIRAHPELAGKAMVAKASRPNPPTSKARRASRNARPRSLRASSSSTPTTTRALASRSSWRCAGRAARGCPSRRSSTPLRGGWTTTPTSSGRGPAQHPPHCRDSPERQVRCRARAGQRRVGLARGTRPSTRPRLCRKGQLTVTYLTDAHRACAERISHWMRDRAALTRWRSTPWATWWAATTRQRTQAHATS